VLLSDRTNSIMDVGLSVGYSRTSSFTFYFRKIAEQTPDEFLKNLT
jgi:AraC-like DNA-binding protein